MGARVRFLFGMSVWLCALSACDDMEDEAQNQFSTSYSCPKGRIVLRERKDLSPSSVMWGPEPSHRRKFAATLNGTSFGKKTSAPLATASIRG